MSGNITDVFGKVSLQVGGEIDGFCSVVTTTSCKESWQPPLPVTNDLRAILPSDCLSKVNIHEHVVEKTSVKVVESITANTWHHYISYNPFSCIA